MMTAGLRSWWQKIKIHRGTILVVVIILVVVVALIIVGYRFNWTGFNGNNKSGKTLWDWLQLLIIPTMLAVAGLWFNQIQKARDQKAAEAQKQREENAAKEREKLEHQSREDNQREMALNAYIDQMAELLLHENLRESQPEDEVRKIARVRTLTMLPRLDGKRKGSVLQFLHESGLIDIGNSFVDLKGADLSRVYLWRADLSGAKLKSTNLRKAYLGEANLRGASLGGAYLEGADLSGAKLSDTYLGDAYLWEASLRDANLINANLSNANLGVANLSRADLFGANLSGANLSGAKVTTEQLDTAKSLKGATMPDGSEHP